MNDKTDPGYAAIDRDGDAPLSDFEGQPPDVDRDPHDPTSQPRSGRKRGQIGAANTRYAHADTSDINESGVGDTTDRSGNESDMEEDGVVDTNEVGDNTSSSYESGDEAQYGGEGSYPL